MEGICKLSTKLAATEALLVLSGDIPHVHNMHTYYVLCIIPATPERNISHPIKIFRHLRSTHVMHIYRRFGEIITLDSQQFSVSRIKVLDG